jgi:hypothetical protein
VARTRRHDGALLSRLLLACVLLGGCFDFDGLLHEFSPDLFGADLAGADLAGDMASSGADLAMQPLSFADAATVTVATNPVAVVIAQLDAQPALDIAVSNTGSGTVWVLYNDGSGNFSGSASITPNGPPYGVACVDTNGDSKIDIVSAGTDGELDVARGDGIGNFLNSVNVSLTPSAPRGLAHGLFDGNSSIDFVTANSSQNNISVILWASPPTVASVAVAGAPFDVAVADFDKTTGPDLITANFTGNNLTVLTNDGTGTFTAGASTISVPNGPIALATGDLNTDGWPDVVVATHGTPTLTVLLNDKSGTPMVSGSILFGAAPEGVALGDLDGDGILDAVVTLNTLTKNVAVLVGKGDGSFANPVYLDSKGDGPIGVAIGDVGGSTFPDIVVTNSNSGTIAIFINNKP